MKKILIVGGMSCVGTELTQILLKNFHLTIYDLFDFDWILKNIKK
tara:strand:+ start:694 stop:828 length:135 start_codon:yes stop_codon:yes gene_type:complete